ncbi:MAG: hypothetical protein HONBIEJF_01597 [Fimbriimonadaceae bacterium]|nr:hypothetical protein [Fimbriimonadaceae bacterium]
METVCTEQKDVLAELEVLAPGVPFLALGQTVFWDEPLKSGVVKRARDLGFPRAFVAGIHDTDYFAKHPGGKRINGRYVAVPHNDTTTKDLWSAAGEFSALFGSETIVTREALQRSGVKVARISRDRPDLLNQATEAYGWRGVVANDAETRITAELPLRPLFPVLYDTLKWAVDESVLGVPASRRKQAQEAADQFLGIACDTSDPLGEQTLADYYERLLPEVYRFVSGESSELSTTRTTELLRFNTETAGQARFRIADAFLRPVSAADAAEAYDHAIEGSEMYPLHRFGTGALPFDLVVPGHGRGTLRIGSKGLVVMTPKPLFATLKRPITSIHDLAEVVERKWGSNCTLIGKAVTLIGMLASEFVFVFHHGASSYVRFSKILHQRLRELDEELHFHPILRVRYAAWDSIDDCGSWFRLPEPLKGPFGTEELCGPSFAARWRQVGEEQRELLKTLGELRRPFDLIEYFQSRFGASWKAPAEEYRELRNQLDSLQKKIREIKAEKAKIGEIQRDLKRERQEVELAKGRHWREQFFEKTPTEEARRQRDEFIHRVRALSEQLKEQTAAWQALQRRQDELVTEDSIRRAHERRRNIELEAELHRLQLVRNAVIASDGLELAGRRPSAWWFPIVCPQGAWYRSTVERATYRLEPLNS